MTRLKPEKVAEKNAANYDRKNILVFMIRFSRKFKEKSSF
jgi:hypothetical protein